MKSTKTTKAACENLKMPFRLGTVMGQKTAAARVGVPLSVVKAAQRDGCMAFTASGRVNLDILTDWLGSREGGRVIDWEERLTKAQALLKEQQLKEREGVLVEVEEALAMLREALTPIRQYLLALPATLCARCNPSDPQHAREALEAWVTQTLTAVADAERAKI